MTVIYTNRIPEYGSEVEARLAQVVRKRGAQLLAESRKRVPVVTGNLKNSSSVQWAGTRAVVTYGANYAAFVELGTRYLQPPRHYLHDAFMFVKPFVVADIAEAMR